MHELILPIRNLINVSPGARLSADMPVRDRRYKTLFLEAAATGKTDIAEILDKVYITLNGKPNRELTVGEIRHLAAVNGTQYAGTDTPLVLPIHFAQDWLWTVDSAEALALGTGDLINFKIEADVKSGLAGLDVKGWYVADTATIAAGQANAGTAVPSGFILRTQRDRKTATGAQEIIINDIDFQGLVKRMHFASDKITKVQVRAKRAVIFEQTKAQNTLWLKQNDMVPDANWFVVAFDATQKVADGITPADLGEYEIYVTTSAAVTFDIITEFIDQIAR